MCENTLYRRQMGMGTKTNKSSQNQIPGAGGVPHDYDYDRFLMAKTVCLTSI